MKKIIIMRDKLGIIFMLFIFLNRGGIYFVIDNLVILFRFFYGNF